MKKTRLFTFLFILLACVTTANLSSAEQEKYLLRHSTKDLHVDYVMNQRGTLSLFADNLPLPGASIDIRDIEMRTRSIQWMEYSGYSPETDLMTLKIGYEPTPEFWLGYDFFKLPPLDTFLKELFDQLDLPVSKSDLMQLDQMNQASTINLEITPQGELMGFDMELPPEAGSEGKMAMGMIENYLTGMIEPDFPLEPIAVGDKWTQAIKLNKIPVAELPVLIVENSLLEVVKTPCGKTFGRISVDINWHHDFPQINEIAKGEMLEYYAGKEFEVVSIIPSIDVKMQGEIWMNIAQGYYQSMEMNTEVVIGLDANLKKTAGHNAGDVWKPRLEYKICTQQDMTATSVCDGKGCDEEEGK